MSKQEETKTIKQSEVWGTGQTADPIYIAVQHDKSARMRDRLDSLCKPKPDTHKG